MGNSLEQLLAEGVVSEVLARLQSGKEAEVYVVRFGSKVVAAKVYKERAHRSFKNDAAYKEGRSVRNSRSQRAMDRGTRFGRAAAEDAWKTAEADALYKLQAAGVRVPEPVVFLDGILLMELVLDANGEPARRLIDTDLTVEQANRAYHDMLGQLVRILSCDLIHGDLSPYNVLWGAEGPVVIDFPQIISAAHNSSSERFFLRDADNILGHFARIDPSLCARRSDPHEIWRAYLRRELSPDFRPTGRAAAPPPRAFVPHNAPQAGRPAPQHPRPQHPGGSERHPQQHAGGHPQARPQQHTGGHQQARPQQHTGGHQQTRPQQHAGGHQQARPQQHSGGSQGHSQHPAPSHGRPPPPPQAPPPRSFGRGRRPAPGPEVIVRPRRVVDDVPPASTPSPTTEGAPPLPAQTGTRRR
ncbi:MAG TPA: RIO1 family regulatory kinase/ATPase [Polyangiaceae bacterium]